MTKQISLFLLGFTVALLFVFAILFKGNMQYVKLSVKNVYNLDNYKNYNSQKKSLNPFFQDTSYQKNLGNNFGKNFNATNDPSFGMQSISDSISKLYLTSFTSFLATSDTLLKQSKRVQNISLDPWIWVPIDQFIAYANFLQLDENRYKDATNHTYKTDGVRITFGMMEKSKMPASLLAKNDEYYTHANGAIIPLFFSTYTDSVLENGKWMYRLNNNPLTPAADCNCGNPPRCNYDGTPCSKLSSESKCYTCPGGGYPEMQIDNSYIVDFFNTVF
jgi:hypothetical protein